MIIIKKLRFVAIKIAIFEKYRVSRLKSGFSFQSGVVDAPIPVLCPATPVSLHVSSRIGDFRPGLQALK
jgi:hypothetical protein